MNLTKTRLTERRCTCALSWGTPISIWFVNITKAWNMLRTANIVICRFRSKNFMDIKINLKLAILFSGKFYKSFSSNKVHYFFYKMFDQIIKKIFEIQLAFDSITKIKSESFSAHIQKAFCTTQMLHYKHRTLGLLLSSHFKLEQRIFHAGKLNG